MSLLHHRLPGLASYQTAARLQDQLVRALLSYRADPHRIAEPSPALITAQFHPVYTCGRREIGTVSQKQQDFLRADGAAEFFEASRGGQTTFHGPGQLVAYPIIDLRRHDISPKDYVRLLENVVMNTCKSFGVPTQVTENPGVWVSPERKICSVGIHLRRYMTSHGIGLNISTDMRWFNRIIACGLPDKSTTSLALEGREATFEEVERRFVEMLARRLELDVLSVQME